MKNEISSAGNLIKIIEDSRNNALKKVNEELIRMYWNVGEYLTKEDLLSFNYSPDMFDDKKTPKPINPSRPSNPGASSNNTYSNKHDEDNYGDPNYPNLEPPTARQILEPFKKFFSEFQNLTIQGKATQCPTWSFNALNRTYTIDSHCPILEQNRAILGALFTLIWSIIAIRKLLSA